jgi:hypothetical protein
VIKTTICLVYTNKYNKKMPPKKTIPASVDSSMSSFSVPEPVAAKKPAAVPKSTPSTTVKINPNDSDRLQLAQSINNLVLRGESFVAAMEELNTFSKERLVDLDLKIEAKKQEYQYLTVSLENQFKDVEIKLKQNLQENKLVAVKDVLTGLNMMYIETAEHTRMVTELEHLKTTTANQLAQAVAAEKASGEAALKQAIHNQNLAHKAEIASLTAQVEQQVKEIGVLKETFRNLKHEIADQRSLTKEVAIASSKSQIQQSFGGKQ